MKHFDVTDPWNIWDFLFILNLFISLCNLFFSLLYMVYFYQFMYSFSVFQALNLILLTSCELSELRNLLKQSLVNSSGKDLFVSLYASWCHSPMAIISLCLLAQVYFENFVMVTIWSLSWLLNNISHCFLVQCQHSLHLLSFVILLDRHINMRVLWFNLWWRRILMSNFWSSWISWFGCWKLQSLHILDYRCLSWSHIPVIAFTNVIELVQHAFFYGRKWNH